MVAYIGEILPPATTTKHALTVLVPPPAKTNVPMASAAARATATKLAAAETTVATAGMDPSIAGQIKLALTALVPPPVPTNAR